jgi:hypothetical protein
MIAGPIIQIISESARAPASEPAPRAFLASARALMVVSSAVLLRQG